jgi:hypothetical protein
MWAAMTARSVFALRMVVLSEIKKPPEGGFVGDDGFVRR